VSAGDERLPIVASGVLDQGEVQPFAAVGASTLAGEGALLDSEHPQRIEGAIIVRQQELGRRLIPHVPSFDSPPGTDWPAWGVREVEERVITESSADRAREDDALPLGLPPEQPSDDGHAGPSVRDELHRLDVTERGTRRAGWAPLQLGGCEGERLYDAHPIRLVFLEEGRLGDYTVHRQQGFDAFLRLLERDRCRALVSAECRVRRWVGSRLAVRGQLRVHRPERAHHRAQLLVGLRHGVGDNARKLAHMREVELEPRMTGEEASECLQIRVGDFGGRHPRIVQREREGDVLGDPLRIELAVGAREVGIYVLEYKGEECFERLGFHLPVLFTLQLVAANWTALANARARAEAVGEAWHRDEPDRVGELHVELPGFGMQRVARGRFGWVHLASIVPSAAWPTGEGG
jgi:hypothetical protein